MWTKSEDGTLVTESSTLTAERKVDTDCPVCGQLIRRTHITEERDNEGEITGWRINHPCGTKLLIIND